MSDRERAEAGCEDAFKDGISKMVGVLFQGWAGANTPAAKDELVERFRRGLAMHKEAHARAQQAIDQTFP